MPPHTGTPASQLFRFRVTCLVQLAHVHPCRRSISLYPTPLFTARLGEGGVDYLAPHVSV